MLSNEMIIQAAHLRAVFLRATIAAMSSPGLKQALKESEQAKKNVEKAVAMAWNKSDEEFLAEVDQAQRAENSKHIDIW